MKTYILTVAGAVLLSAVVAILVSDGKMGKFVKGMSKLLVFSLVVAPLIGLFGEKNVSLSAAEIGSDEGYLSRCVELLVEEDERAIEDYLSETYSIIAKVLVERKTGDGFPREKITVNLFDLGIFGQDEHINTVSKLQTELEERFGCKTEVVWQGTESKNS